MVIVRFGDGDAVELPMTETHPYNNKNFYGATKIAGEAMATAFNDRCGLQVIGLRYKECIRPHQDQTAAHTGVIPTMPGQDRRHEAPVINGDEARLTILSVWKMWHAANAGNEIRRAVYFIT